MRILYLITRAERGGAQKHVLQLAAAAAREHTVMVGVGEEGVLCEELRALGIPYRVLGHLKHAPHPWHDVAGLVEILSLIREVQPEVVHAHSGKAGVVGRIAARVAGVPSVYTAHGFAFGEQAPWPRRLFSLVGERVAGLAGDYCIAVSRAECRLAVQHKVVSAGRIGVIYNGAEETRLRAVAEGEPPVIAMVARFAYPKQQELLISAFGRLRGNARLWLIGEGPGLASAKETARKSGAGDRILFWGDRPDVLELLAQTQIAALISAEEGFGLSLIEAMSVGLPVVATDTGGMRDVVVDGTTGLLVRNGDVPQLAAALERLVRDAGERRRLGSAGLLRFRQQFTAERTIAETLGVYEWLVRSRRERAPAGCMDCTFPQCGQVQGSLLGD